MQNINRKLAGIYTKVGSDSTLKILIFGLGSVGNYLLDYLMAWPEKNIELHVCVRSPEKATPDINILKVSNLIRYQQIKPVIVHNVDLNDTDSITAIFKVVSPDFIVNSSRVYSGLKYGSISWSNIRAYGLWSPLSIKFIRNIMKAYKSSGCNGIVINTSYSDVVNNWLKSAGLSYPDFGSGNINHLIPRIKMAVAEQIGISDCKDIEVTLATSHFHDVVISKEGHTEGIDPLLNLRYLGKELSLDMNAVYKKCAIPMPVDAKRNMMNASSNFEIIAKIINAARVHSQQVIHTPGVAGFIGGYPVRIDFRTGTPEAQHCTFIEDFFSLHEMQKHNRSSIALDGIEDVSNGVLSYTDKLCEKVEKSFGVVIPKHVPFNKIEETADFLIDKIIKPKITNAK